MMEELSIPAAIILGSVLIGIFNSGLQILDRMFISRRGGDEYNKPKLCKFDPDKSANNSQKQNELMGSMLGGIRQMQTTGKDMIGAVRDLRESIQSMRRDQQIYHERLISQLGNSEKKLDVVIQKVDD